MKKSKNAKITSIVAIIAMVVTVFAVYLFSDDKDLQREVVEKATDTIVDMVTYEMSEEDIKQLPSTQIVGQTVEDEEEVSKEQEVEDEGFELQGNIAYEGDRANTWNVELGDYKGLTYYSQIDSRWSNKMYSSIGDRSQTIGLSGCGPTSASMVVTACKGTITPDTMADLFVKYGYRSANSGTYWSAFRAVADEFNIGYQETTNIDTAVNLLRNNNYVVASVGNGLFTTGGHFIVLVGIEGNTIKVYDPYLYSGKFDTSTRRGKATVNGNTVYVSVDNFKRYANFKGAFCYAHDGNVQENSQPVSTGTYTRYVNTSSKNLNVRSTPNGSIIGSLKKGTQVTVLENNGNWSHILNPTNGWVSSTYLGTSPIYTNQVSTSGTYYRLKTKSYIYSKSNLTGTKYTYLAQTQIKVLYNVSDNIDYVQVVKTGRKGYISKSAYTITGVKSTSGTYRRLKNKTTLYSKSNLTGTRYSYLPDTQVKILNHISSIVDYIQVVKTGRYAYVNVNNYK